MTSNTKRLCPVVFSICRIFAGAWWGGGGGLGRRGEGVGISNIFGFKILMTISCVIANIFYAAPSGSFNLRGSTIGNSLKEIGLRK